MASSSGGQQQPKERERVGNYLLGSEIGRGSFAVVQRGYRVADRLPVAIKVVHRSKMNAKLQANLEAEIAILKSIKHGNIVGLSDCLKTDDKIYLIMEYCSGMDLSHYIKKRGKLPTLEYLPPGSGPEGRKQYWPHPDEGGLDEVVVRAFVAQLAMALRFLRSQNLIHRDIKPGNLLLQPSTPAERALGHPTGIPVLKVADFGFARFLEGATMAETLCGSPLYMAPEILRYEKYDAKADLWSVGTVLFEMSVGRPPFKAQNHVELLKKIEKGEDRIKFPDEKSSFNSPDDIAANGGQRRIGVAPDVKELIRGLLKRNPVGRMGFEEFFGNKVVRDGEKMLAGAIAAAGTEPVKMPKEATVESTAPTPLSLPSSIAQQQPTVPVTPAVSSIPTRNSRNENVVVPLRPAPPPPADVPPFAILSTPISRPLQQQLVEQSPQSEPVARRDSSSGSGAVVGPREIDRKSSGGSIPPLPDLTRDSSLDENLSPSSHPPITPQSLPGIIPVHRRRSSTHHQSSPMSPVIKASGGGEKETLDDGSMVGKDYVVVEKRTVEINSLADELDAAAHKRPTLSGGTDAGAGAVSVNRRRSSRSLLSRPLSALSPSSPPTTAGGALGTVVAGVTNSPNSSFFALSTTPPFALSSSPNRPSPLHHASGPPIITRQPSVAIHHSSTAPYYFGTALQRFSSSPTTMAGGVLARAFSNASLRLFGTSPSSPTGAVGGKLARVGLSTPNTALMRKTLVRAGDVADPAEEGLLAHLDELAQKAYVITEFADIKVAAILPLVQSQQAPNALSSGGLMGTNNGSSTSLFSTANNARKRTSSNASAASGQSEASLAALKVDVVSAEALILYLSALKFLQKGMEAAKDFWTEKVGREGSNHETSADLNEAVQWFRARFNECFEKAEWTKARCGDELPESAVSAGKLIYEKALEIFRSAATTDIVAANGSLEQLTSESGYETACWMLRAVLDDTMRDGEAMEEEASSAIQKFLASGTKRLESIRYRIAAAKGTPQAVLTPTA